MPSDLTPHAADPPMAAKTPSDKPAGSPFGEITAAEAALVAAVQAAFNGDVALRLDPETSTVAIRRLLIEGRGAAPAPALVRLARAVEGERLAAAGAVRLAVWGGREPWRTVDLARRRFSAAAPLALVETPEQALAAARAPGVVAVLALEGPHPWWGRLLAEPSLRVFARLPDLLQEGPAAALAVAAVEVGPTGGDEAFFVTDAPGSSAAVIAGLAEQGAAAELVAQAAGLKLLSLAGYWQAHDARLAAAPGRLTGVIGAGPLPFDV